MNTEPGSSTHLHVPFTLLALAIAIFLGAQVGAASRNGKTTNWQLKNLEKQNANLKEAQKQYVELLQKREELVKQSNQVRAQYTSLLNDVLDLAKDDGDAKGIVQKFGIQRQAAPEAGAAAPSGDSKPAAAPPANP